MNDKLLDVVVAGHICLDIIPGFERRGKEIAGEIFVPGKLVNIGEASIATGGVVSNTALSLLKLGTKVGFICKVGDDLFGDAIIRHIGNYTDDISGIKKVRGQNSSYSIVIAPPGVDRIIFHNPGTNNTFGFEDINFELVRNSKIFHLGYPPLLKRLYSNGGRELVRIFEKAKSTGATTSLDMSLPDPLSESGQVDWESILAQLMSYVDIFLPSIEEAIFMVNRDRYDMLKRESDKGPLIDMFTAEDLNETSEKLLKFGAKILVLKCSHRGTYIRTGNRKVLGNIVFERPDNLDNWAGRELWAPSYHVKQIASAVGSGDCSIAGFLVAFLKGESIEVTIKCANAGGAHNLRAMDSVSGIGTWDEIKSMVKNTDVELNELKIGTSCWNYNENMRMWEGPADKKV